jgi:O-methyltransferase
MAEEFLSVVALSGDVADLGTYRGGTALILRRLAPEKVLHCFDTWEGTPYNDPLCHHKKESWKSDLEDCRAIVGNDSCTHYYQGVFPSSAVGLEGSRFCFVYIDMDTYQSTRDAIKFFWPLLIDGGKLFIDDWNWLPCAGVEKAVRESFSESQLVIKGNICIIGKN